MTIVTYNEFNFLIDFPSLIGSKIDWNKGRKHELPVGIIVYQNVPLEVKSYKVKKYQKIFLLINIPTKSKFPILSQKNLRKIKLSLKQIFHIE